MSLGAPRWLSFYEKHQWSPFSDLELVFFVRNFEIMLRIGLKFLNFFPAKSKPKLQYSLLPKDKKLAVFLFS